jgi:hypothetical protein
MRRNRGGAVTDGDGRRHLSLGAIFSQGYLDFAGAFS